MADNDQKAPEPNQVEVKKPQAKPEPEKGKNIPWLMIGLGLVSLLGIGISFYLLSQLSGKALSVQQLRTQVLAYQISDQDEKLLTQALADSVDQRFKLEAAFPNEETLLDFIKIIDRLKTDQVEVVRFSVDSDIPTKIGRNPSFLPLTLGLKGPKDQVEQALAKISSSSYFIRPVIYYLDINPEGDQVVVNTQFHLFVHDEFNQTNP